MPRLPGFVACCGPTSFLPWGSSVCPISRAPTQPALRGDAARCGPGSSNFISNTFKNRARLRPSLRRTSGRACSTRFSTRTPETRGQEQRWQFVFGNPKDAHCLDSATVPERLPPWLTSQDFAIFTQAFERTGFRGGLNWYRNADRTWELTPFLRGAKLRQPALFIAGEHDTLMTLNRPAIDTLEDVMPKAEEKGGAARGRPLDSAGTPDGGQWIAPRVLGRLGHLTPAPVPRPNLGNNILA